MHGENSFLTLQLGQAGAQIGHAVWELLCIEHNIKPDGCLANFACEDTKAAYDTTFFRSPNGRFLPRSLFIDTDSVTIDEIRMGQYRCLFSEEQLLTAGEDAAANYMTGRFGFEKSLVPESVNRIRWMMEKSETTPTFFVMHSTSGGTGSGLTVACLQALQEQSGIKTEVLELSIMPSNSWVLSQTEILNSALYQCESRDLTSLSFTASNGSLYNVCNSSLGVPAATYAHTNRLLAIAVSNLTATERYPGSLPCTMNSISTNILPFRHLKYPILSSCPFLTCDAAERSALTVNSVTNGLFNRSNQFTDVDPTTGKMMACALIYRGAATAFSVNTAIQSLRANSNLQFVDWCPLGFKVGLIDAPPLAAPLSGMGNPSVSATMVSNSTAISPVFAELADSVAKMLNRELFLHHYASGQEADVVQHQLQDSYEFLADLAVQYTAETGDLEEANARTRDDMPTDFKSAGRGNSGMQRRQVKRGRLDHLSGDKGRGAKRAFGGRGGVEARKGRGRGEERGGGRGRGGKTTGAGSASSGSTSDRNKRNQEQISSPIKKRPSPYRSSRRLQSSSNLESLGGLASGIDTADCYGTYDVKMSLIEDSAKKHQPPESSFRIRLGDADAPLPKLQQSNADEESTDSLATMEIISSSNNPTSEAISKEINDDVNGGRRRRKFGGCCLRRDSLTENGNAVAVDVAKATASGVDAKKRHISSTSQVKRNKTRK